jgi:hypothetical protein
MKIFTLKISELFERINKGCTLFKYDNKFYVLSIIDDAIWCIPFKKENKTFELNVNVLEQVSEFDYPLLYIFENVDNMLDYYNEAKTCVCDYKY